MEAHEAMRHLTVGLVGNRQHLYNTSATFRANVDALAQMLPLWVDGIADKAEEADRRMVAAVEAACLGAPHAR